LFQTLRPPLEPLPEIHTAAKFEWTFEKSKEIAGSAGLFAQALAIITGVSGDVSGSFSNTSSQNSTSKELYTQFIEPDDKYVTASAQAEAAQKVLRGFMGKNIYMITGVKVVHEASVTFDASKEVGGSADLAADGTSIGIPVQVGHKASFSRNNKEMEGFGSSTPFVLACRMRKIFIRPWSKTVQSREVRGGELHAHGDESSDEEYEEGSGGDIKASKEVELLSASISTEDFGHRTLPPGFEVKQVKDESEDEECLLMYPITSDPAEGLVTV
jgi:hypothetical protein